MIKICLFMRGNFNNSKFSVIEPKTYAELIEEICSLTIDPQHSSICASVFDDSSFESEKEKMEDGIYREYNIDKFAADNALYTTDNLLYDCPADLSYNADDDTYTDGDTGEVYNSEEEYYYAMTREDFSEDIALLFSEFERLKELKK